jgi:pantoate kinase
LSSKTAKAFAPAAISSFFEICDTQADGSPIADLEKAGARGGGFGLQRGVMTEVWVSEAKQKRNRINVFINSAPAPEAETTKTVLRTLLAQVEGNYDVVAKHVIDVPIGAGFGTSAGGALTAGLALKQALELPLTLNQLGKVAHVAEIQCQTGLGTVSSLALAHGCVLVVEPGAPGICVVDRIPLTPDYAVVAGVFQSTPKKTVLSSPEKRREVNRCGRKTLDAILAEPSLENFLVCCWQFALDAGFATERVKHLVQAAKKAGAVGAAQNMLGEAVHAVTLEENADAVAEAFKQALPPDKILVSKIDFQGARLVSKA